MVTGAIAAAMMMTETAAKMLAQEIMVARYKHRSSWP